MDCETEIFRIPDHKRGTTWDGMLLTVTKLDENNIEQPVDYTGSSIVARFRKGKEGLVTFEFNTSDDSIVFGARGISDPTSGEIVFKKRLIEYPAGDYFLELLEICSDGNVYPVIGDAWWNITN